MSKAELIPQVIQLLNEDLELNDSYLSASNDFERLKARIKEVVQQLMERNIGEFFNMLYRLDISEAKFRRILAGDIKEDLYSDLAELIIAREIQKAESRLYYRENPPENEAENDETW